MAHVYIGDSARVDKEVLNAVCQLPDDYWVFAEFSVGRNVDWFIVREVSATQPNGHGSTLIVTELKRPSRTLKAVSSDVAWEEEVDGTWQRVETSNEDDTNYYWQAVNTANAVGRWLWNNQRVYREAADVVSGDRFRVWPDLLFLSPPGVSHRFPLRPNTGYGRWWFDLDEWRAHVLGWEPRVSAISLTGRELANLADALRLTPLKPAAKEPRPSPDDALEAFAAWSHRLPGDPGPGPDRLVAWLRELSEQVRSLERRVAGLEPAGRQAGPNGSGPVAGSAPMAANSALARPSIRPAQGAPGAVAERSAPAPSAPPVSRSWTNEEKQALMDAIGDLRWSGRSRSLPSVLEYMNDHLGYSLRETAYNGYGTAAAMFERARVDGLIRYGAPSGPNPTIYLPDE